GVYEAAKEAAAKKRAEKKAEEEQRRAEERQRILKEAPVRVPDSENIDIILAREMTAKRLAGTPVSARAGAQQTHRMCQGCSMYIDATMSTCPHCQTVQAPVLV